MRDIFSSRGGIPGINGKGMRKHDLFGKSSHDVIGNVNSIRNLKTGTLRARTDPLRGGGSTLKKISGNGNTHRLLGM